MKKTRILAIVLSLCMLLALVPVAALAAEFTDADEVSNASFAGAIDRWADEGVISGNPDGSFDPKGTMSRVQGFGIIAELLNLTEKADLSEYTDVPTATWKADYLAKVVAAGIVTGYPDKTLRPEGELTREQMFVTIAKTLGIQPVETDDEEFEDIGEATSYAAPYINALHKMGAVNGSNGNVNPLDTLSREGAALLLDNLIGGYANEDGDTATIEEGKITLVVADNVKVEGTANDQPIVVAGQASTVDMDGVEGTPTVNVTVPEVKIENAPVGTTVTVAEDVTDVTVNDETVEAGGEVVVEEEEQPTPPPYNPPAPATYTVTFNANGGDFPINACWGGENAAQGSWGNLQAGTCNGGSNSDQGEAGNITNPNTSNDNDTFTITVTSGTVINLGLLTQPKKGEDQFQYWATKDGNGIYTKVENESAYAVTGNVTFFAVWDTNTITVIFSANGGKFPAAACWGGENNASGQWTTTNPEACYSGENNAVGSSGNLTNNGDNNEFFALTFTDGTSINLERLTKPEKDDATFEFWATAVDAGEGKLNYTKISDQTSFKPTQKVTTIYAVWSNTCNADNQLVPGISGNIAG